MYQTDDLRHHAEINAVKYLEDCSTRKSLSVCDCATSRFLVSLIFQVQYLSVVVLTES